MKNICYSAEPYLPLKQTSKHVKMSAQESMYIVTTYFFTSKNEFVLYLYKKYLNCGHLFVFIFIKNIYNKRKKHI